MKKSFFLGLTLILLFGNKPISFAQNIENAQNQKKWDYPVYKENLVYGIYAWGISSGYATFSSLGKTFCIKNTKRECFHFRYSVHIDSLFLGDIRVLSEVYFFADSQEPYSVLHYVHTKEKLQTMEMNFLYEKGKLQFIEQNRKSKMYYFDLMSTTHLLDTLPITLRYSTLFHGSQKGTLFYNNKMNKIKVNCRLVHKSKIKSKSQKGKTEIRICGTDQKDYLHFKGKNRIPTYILLMPIKFLGFQMGSITAQRLKSNKNPNAPFYTPKDFHKPKKETIENSNSG